MLRALANDVDLAGGTVTVREKKRVKGRRSDRTAPLTPNLAEVPRVGGGPARKPVSVLPVAARDAQQAEAGGPDGGHQGEAHDHFKRTVAVSKWQVLRGHHVLRHSFISALASEGVDQRVIDEVVGHQSEEQRKRYRHLYPGVMREAITRVFG
jgi:integrase